MKVGLSPTNVGRILYKAAAMADGWAQRQPDAGKGRAMVLDISIGGAAILIIGAGASDPHAASRCGALRTRAARGGRPDSTIAS